MTGVPWWAALHAHAASLTVSDCSSDSQLQSDVSNAAAGDTITFSCSGTIAISSTLSISKNLTIDGSGQSVTLDGGNSRRVIVVNGGTSLTLNALTIAHGKAASNALGGGLDNFGTVTISNSTFANNFAGAGGGVGDESGSTVTISNSTFANNTGANLGGGLFTGFTGTASISNSTFANNSGGECNQLNSLTDQGYNLSDDSSCSFTNTGSLQNTDPKLAPLANNGGSTQTIALQSGSPATDTIPAAQCPATDQRGVSRPDNGESTCDMGAYEFVDPPPDHDLALTNVPANITVDATSPQGATVTYTAPTVVDEDSPLPAVSCTPASGSTFAIGTTTVTCTVSDSDDSNSPVSASFTVTVNGAATQVNELIAMINGFNLPGTTSKSYISQLQMVQADLSANNTAQACLDLTGFINHVEAQSGKQLTVSQANQLITGAKRIQAVLGC